MAAFLSPEKQEVARRQAELDELEERLAQQELDLATLKGELEQLNTAYLRIVGSRYAELDKLKALIAEAQARATPTKEAHEKVAQAQSQARDSADAANSIDPQNASTDFKPTGKLKDLYRGLAKLIHPDHAVDDEDRKLRHKLMSRANEAYRQGNEVHLEAIVQEWHSNPESVKGGDIGSVLIRLIRQKAQIGQRLAEADEEVSALKASDLYTLRTKIAEASLQGKDLLLLITQKLDEEIDALWERLTRGEQTSGA